MLKSCNVLASMGPRLFSRGNLAQGLDVHNASIASMGPRLFSRGNVNALGSLASQGLKLQWGHDFSAVEMI